MSNNFFSGVAAPIAFGGLDSTDPLTYKVYDPNRVVLGKRMEDQLRIAVCRIAANSLRAPRSLRFPQGHILASQPVAQTRSRRAHWLRHQQQCQTQRT